MSAVSADWLVPVDGPPIENGLLRWEDGEIVEVTTGRADQHYESAVLLPGFVNAHTHLEYSVYAGFADGRPFAPWLTTHVLRKRLLDYDDMLALARLGTIDSLASGITTVADYSYSGASATAAREAGLRAIVYLEVFGREQATAEQRYDQLRARAEAGELVQLGISPHAPYTCSLDVYRWCLGLGVPVGTHLAESEAENAWLEHGGGPWRDLDPPPPLQPTGKRAVATLESVLGPELLCAHCVDVTSAEITLLAERSVPVAHCPRSNALLGCGIAPVGALRAAGVTVGLGTDSPASAPSFDMFEELRAAVYMARSREQDAGALNAADALRLATIDAARALRIDDQVGTLTPGKRADVTVVSLAGSPYHPVEDPAAAIVLGGSPERVLVTIVDGDTRYRRTDREEQWPEVRNIASAARRKMLALPPQ